MLTPTRSIEQTKYDQIYAWAAALASDDAGVRQSARASLIAAGSSAVSALVGNLSSPDERVRWESAYCVGRWP